MFYILASLKNNLSPRYLIAGFICKNWILRSSRGTTLALILAIAILSNLALAQEKISSRDLMNRQQMEKMRKNMSSQEEVEKAAKEYEAVAVTKMLQQMYSDVKIDPLFGNKNTESIYKDMLLNEYGKLVADNGGIGLAKALTKDVQKMNGAKQ
jgi:peptidoglycan hydrolase FlgJ